MTFDVAPENGLASVVSFFAANGPGISFFLLDKNSVREDGRINYEFIHEELLN